MKAIDEFLQFLLEHSSDNRISISKKMKYGHRYYYLTLNIDESPEDNNGRIGRIRFSDSVEIILDNRNSCIEMLYDHGSENIVVEDLELLNKWNDIIEEYINYDISNKTKKVIEKALSDCHEKNLYREYQMKKILPDNESL